MRRFTTMPILQLLRFSASSLLTASSLHSNTHSFQVCIPLMVRHPSYHHISKCWHLCMMQSQTFFRSKFPRFGFAIPKQASPNLNCLNPNVTIGRNSFGIADLRDSGLIPFPKHLKLLWRTESTKLAFLSFSVTLHIHLIISFSILLKHIISFNCMAIHHSLHRHVVEFASSQELTFFVPN